MCSKVVTGSYLFIFLSVCAHRTKICKTVEWTFPSTDEERLRYKIFKDFWESGHFLTSGSNFGGDFLVYPGKPSLSIFITIIKKYLTVVR